MKTRARGSAGSSASGLFERFVRFNQSGTEDRGSGLGLAICRSIIQLHNGRIHAEPGSAGKGLRVVFEIPAADAGDKGTAQTGH